MEYPFKDLLPLDEVLEREGYYKDWTHLDPNTFYSIVQISDMIKTKGFGSDVRLLISQLAEHFGLSVVEITDIANDLIARQSTVEDRQDAVEHFNNQVIQEMTDKDVISAPEIIKSRWIFKDLSERLDKTLKTVNYDMFKHDGYSDDETILATHTYANENGCDVVNLDGEYHLSEPLGIPIKTNVDWGKTKFYVDESQSGKHFIIPPTRPKENIISMFTEGQISSIVEKINNKERYISELSEYENHMVMFSNSAQTIAKRDHPTDTQSWSAQEIVFIGKGGAVEGDFYWNFTGLTSIQVYFAEENYLNISGGTFELNGVAPEGVVGSAYVYSGLDIRRSRTTISDINVKVPNDNLFKTEKSSAGFFQYFEAYDVRFKDIVGTPRKYKDSTITNNRGSYLFEGSYCFKVHYENVTATAGNDHWSAMGQNKIKKLVVKSSNLNTVDVHFDARDVDIEDSVINFIKLVGGGKLRVKNSEVHNNRLISFREDYGAFWNGDIEIDNVTQVITSDGDTSILDFYRTNGTFYNRPQIGVNVIIHNVTQDFKNFPSNENENFIIKLGGVELAYFNSPDGALLMFDKLDVKSVKHRNKNNLNKSGFNLFRLNYPNLANARKAGDEKSIGGIVSLKGMTEITSNVSMSFDDVDLDARYDHPQTGNHSSLTIGRDTGNTGFSEYSIYPKIEIKNCNDLKLFIYDSPADITIDNSELVQMYNFANSLSRSKTTIINTDIKGKYKKITSVGDIDHFRRSNETNLISCKLQAFEIDGVRNRGLALRLNGLINIVPENLSARILVSVATGCQLSSELLTGLSETQTLEAAYELNQAISDANNDIYVVPKASSTPPVLPKWGTLSGMVYFSKTDQKMYRYNGANWIV